MKCQDCEYEKVCNSLLYGQVKFGMVKCKQGRKKKEPKVKLPVSVG